MTALGVAGLALVMFGVCVGVIWLGAAGGFGGPLDALEREQRRLQRSREDDAHR